MHACLSCSLDCVESVSVRAKCCVACERIFRSREKLEREQKRYKEVALSPQFLARLEPPLARDVSTQSRTETLVTQASCSHECLFHLVHACMLPVMVFLSFARVVCFEKIYYYVYINDTAFLERGIRLIYVIFHLACMCAVLSLPCATMRFFSVFLSGPSSRTLPSLCLSFFVMHPSIPVVIQVTIAGFHCHATKKGIQNYGVKKLKNIIGCRKLPDILFIQVSGLYGILYSSYPSKCSTQIYRALYGNAMLVPMQLGTNMAAGNQRKHLVFNSAIKGSYITLMNK